MKQDPSTRNGEFSKQFERKCNVEIKIVETPILQLVGKEDIASLENLQFKVLVKNSDKRDSAGDFIPEVLRLELMSDNDYFFQYIYE